MAIRTDFRLNWSGFRPQVTTLLAALVCISVSVPFSVSLYPQSSPSSPAASAPHQPAGSSRHKTKKQLAAEKAAADQAAAEQAARTAEAPPVPKWPANDKAVPAAVDWNGKDLSISASNASLAQILHDVSTATGVKIEGLGADQRVFGSYGPSEARDVLVQLMEGSGYNVLIIGDTGEGTPRQLVLTAKAKGATAPQSTNGQPNPNSDDEAAEEPEPPETQPDPAQRRPLNGGNQPPPGARTPQQMMQELQQRQQQQLSNPAAPTAPNPQ